MPEELDDFTVYQITYMAGKLKGKALFAECDHEDLVSELTVHVLDKRRFHDPAKSCWRTYINRIVAQKGRDMIKNRIRESNSIVGRSVHPMTFSGVFDEDGDPLSLAEVIPDARPPLVAEIAHVLDLKKFMKSLPKNFPMVAELLQTHTQTETAQQMNIPLQTLRRYYINPLRRWLRRRRPEYFSR